MEKFNYHKLFHDEFQFWQKTQIYRKIFFLKIEFLDKKKRLLSWCFALIQILLLNQKKIQIWYFDRDTIISQKKSTKNYWKNIGGKYKMNIELGEGVTKFFLKILIFCLAQLNFCLFFLFICWCCYYYYYWFQIPWYLLFYKTKYKAHCWHSVLKPWIRSWIW